jgi:DsbC/DsbD-like thiol-disulfide interchange protein
MKNLPAVSLNKPITRRTRRLLQAGALAALAALTTWHSPLFADIGGTSTSVKVEDVSAKVSLIDSRSASGQQIGVMIDFGVAPGWHIYGEPLPPEYTPTKVKFDSDLIQQQSLKFPAPTPLHFEALDQTFPVYHGNFKVVGDVVLKPNLSPGSHKLGGTIEFQECNDSICKIPQSVRFELPLTIKDSGSAGPKA